MTCECKCSHCTFKYICKNCYKVGTVVQLMDLNNCLDTYVKTDYSLCVECYCKRYLQNLQHIEYKK
jgi:hypothetical protein